MGIASEVFKISVLVEGDYFRLSILRSVARQSKFEVLQIPSATHSVDYNSLYSSVGDISGVESISGRTIMNDAEISNRRTAWIPSSDY